MPTIPIPNGVTVEMIYSNASQRMENIYRVTKGSPATAADLLALWTLFKDWENTRARLDRNNNTVLVLISLTANDGPGAPFYEQAPSPTIIGSLGGATANVLSLAVKHTTGKQGRSYRGRTYLIGLSSTVQVNSDIVTPTFAAQLAGSYNLLRTTLLSAGWTFCVASLYSGVDPVTGKAIPRIAGILTPVLASTCEVGIDTQRHRKAVYQV